MKPAGRIRWNSLFSLLSSAVQLLTNALMFWALARFYGPEAFGQFATAHLLSTLFLTIGDFGLDLLFTTEVARQRSEGDLLFRRYASVKLLLASVAVIGMCGVTMIHEFSENTRQLIYVFSPGVAFNSLMNFCFALFRGREKLHYQTQIVFVQNFCLLIGVALFGLLHVPIWSFAVLFVATRALGFLLAAYTARHFVSLRSFHFDFSESKAVFRQGWSFGVHLIFAMLYFQLDTLLLSFWDGDRAVGLYQSVMKLVGLALVLPDVANNAVLPVLARLHQEDKARWVELGGLLNRTLWLLSLPIALIFFVYAELIIKLLYGLEHFAPAVPLMRVAALIVTCRFVLETYGIILTTSGRQFARMTLVVIVTVIAFVLNAYAIPRYGIRGAVWVAMTTNLLLTASLILSARSLFWRWTVNTRYVMPGLFTILLGLILVNTPALQLWQSVPLLLMVCAVIFYFVGYNKNERQLIFSRPSAGSTG